MSVPKVISTSAQRWVQRVISAICGLCVPSQCVLQMGLDLIREWREFEKRKAGFHLSKHDDYLAIGRVANRHPTYKHHPSRADKDIDSK